MIEENLQLQQFGQRQRLFPYEEQQARLGVETTRLGLARGGIELRQMQEEEERRKRFSRAGGPLSRQQERLGIQRSKEQQEYEDRLRPQIRQFEELQRAAQVQELQSKMAFRPAFDQLRMNMMGRMGGGSFGSMAGGPQPMGGGYRPMGGFGGLSYSGLQPQQGSMDPNYQKLVNQYNFSRFSTSPAPWMQNYQAPSFPRY